LWESGHARAERRWLCNRTRNHSIHCNKRPTRADQGHTGAGGVGSQDATDEDAGVSRVRSRVFTSHWGRLGLLCRRKKNSRRTLSHI
jgi:hypothetical protein